MFKHLHSSHFEIMSVTQLVPWERDVVVLFKKEKWNLKEIKCYGSLPWATLFYDLCLDACVLSDYKYCKSHAFHHLGLSAHIKYIPLC